MKKKLIIIWSLTAFFLITYTLSFISKNSKDSRKSIKTTLLNPKNINSLSSFKLSDNSNSILIAYNSKLDLWEIQLDDNLVTTKLPADSNKITKFIDYLSKIIDLYRLSESPTKTDSYGFNSLNYFNLKYTLQDGTTTELIFGGYDFSESYRYMMNSNKLTVYEISSQIDSFLTTSVQSWGNPMIFANEVFNNKTPNDIQQITIIQNNQKQILKPTQDQKARTSFLDYSQTLFSLRHSGFIQEYNYEKLPETEIKILFGDTSEVFMSFYKNLNAEDYLLKLVYIQPISKKQYQYTMKISNWTYNKINTNIL